jgi:hypothetical protein
MTEVREYRKLMDDFVRRVITVDEFEEQYLRVFKNDSTLRGSPIYDILNGVFLDVDAFYPDAAVRDAAGIDESELRTRVREALAELDRAVAGR